MEGEIRRHWPLMGGSATAKVACACIKITRLLPLSQSLIFSIMKKSLMSVLGFAYGAALACTYSWVVYFEANEYYEASRSIS
jgi:hypothetical protein